MILRKIKRFLGLASDDDGRRSERDVTVQERSDTETEAAASTESVVDEEFTQSDATDQAEAAEAAEPESADEPTDAESTAVETGDAAGDEPESEPEEEDNSAPVDEIKGIGPAYSERLGEVGIETVSDLLGADAEEIVERTTVPEKTVRKWIDRASDYE